MIVSGIAKLLNTKGINEVIKYCTGKINTNKAWVAFDRCSHFTKFYGTILNSFSWPRSGEEQDVLNKIHNAVSVDFNKLDW